MGRGRGGTEVLVDSMPHETRFLSTGPAVQASGRVPAEGSERLLTRSPVPTSWGTCWTHHVSAYSGLRDPHQQGSRLGSP